jgi:transcription initiation factor TFIIH subunit 3
VFINAHLAFNQANQVAVIASHTQRAEFLYPSHIRSPELSTNGTTHHDGDDIEMADVDADPTSKSIRLDDANKYRPFRLIQESLLVSLSHLVSTTSPHSLTSTPTTSIAGALTLALSYINKQTTLRSSAVPTSSNPAQQSRSAPSLLSRILILSVSGDLAYQYIPIMNTIFACQRLSIPIDIAKIAGDTVFLQQASDATRGTYIKLEHPQGILQYLMMGFLPDQTNRRNLISPTQVGVDFRAACFCHRDVVDIGFVCSICLSSTYDNSVSLVQETAIETWETSSFLLPP